MDIVVTIPKKEYDNIDWEIAWAKKLRGREKDSTTKNWSMSRLPKKIEPGDRCYFVRDGHIIHYREIQSWDDVSNGFNCEVTDRYWDGPCLELSPIPVNLKNPVPMKGFQGFRYIDRIE